MDETRVEADLHAGLPETFRAIATVYNHASRVLTQPGQEPALAAAPRLFLRGLDKEAYSEVSLHGDDLEFRNIVACATAPLLIAEVVTARALPSPKGERYVIYEFEGLYAVSLP